MDLTLYPRTAVNQRSQRTALWLALILLVVMIGAVVIASMIAGSNDKPVDWTAIGDRFLKRMAEDTFKLVEFLIIGLAVVVQVIYLMWSKRGERLVLDDIGIRYVSPLPRVIAFLKPSWSLQWSQIRRVQIKSSAWAPNPQLLTLVLDAGIVKRSLRPYFWVDPANYRAPSLREQMRLRMQKFEALATEVLDGPLVRFIQNLPDRKFDLPPPAKFAPFALEKNPAALVVVVLFFVFLGYAFVDALILNSESYVGEPFLFAYLTGGIVAFLGALGFLRRASVPAVESAIVALLMGGAFGAALHPGLLRLNELTDERGLIEYQYKMTAPGWFAPIETSLPEIHFPGRHHEFWSQYPLGRVETFKLRKGALGFYQIEMTSVYERIRNWYESRDTHR